MRTSLKLPAAVVAALCLPALCRDARAGSGDEPPRFEVPAPAGAGALTFVVYGDTRFTERAEVVNSFARRALVARIASEHPAAILIGGDLVYEGRDPGDYQVFQSETTVWSRQKIPVFPALGNHEFKGCTDDDASPCLENWWHAFGALQLRPFRWYSLTLGPSLLALVLDSDAPFKPQSEQRVWFERQITSADPNIRFILIVLHHPPVRDPFYPHVHDEKQVATYLDRKAATLRAQVVVVGSHVHNYERYTRHGVVYLVSGGGGAKPVPAARMFGELSRLTTSVNFHYLRFTLENARLRATMVRVDAAAEPGADPWSEPDRFELAAKN
jgi:hypothetical protein